MRKSVDPEKVFDEYCPQDDDIDDTYVKTGVIPVDLLTMGKGLPLRSLIHVWSPAGYGKSTIMYTVVRNLIRNGENVLWVGVERSLPLAESMGLRVNGCDVDNFRYVDVSYYDELQKVTDAWLGSDKYRWMVIDSLTAVCPSPDKMKDDIETNSIGLDARIQAKYLRLYHALIKRHNKSIIFITQSRMQIGIRPGEVTKEHAAGGKATQFYSDIRFTVMGNVSVNSSSTMDAQRDYIAGKSGYLIAEKIRHAPPLVKIPATILFGKGLSNIQALFDYAQWRGIVSGQGWYQCSCNDTNTVRIQGKTNVMNWVKENSRNLIYDFYVNAKDYFQYLQAADGKKLKETRYPLNKDMALQSGSS